LAARTERQALREVIRQLQRAINCVSPVVVNSVPAALDVYTIFLSGQSRGNRYVRLPGGSGLMFSANYVVFQEPGGRAWTATVSTYRYGLYDRNGREILSYHWHPDARSHVTAPHLHIGGGVAPWRPDLAKAHIPTGQVTLEDVLLLAIEELTLDVTPLRADWHDILTRAHSDIL
jgi:hypothetical protein